MLLISLLSHVNAALYRSAIVHRDVKPHKILLDVGYNAVLGDMNHGIELSDVTATNTAEMLGYHDRYRIKDDPFRVHEDVFSLGIGVFVENLYNKLHITVFQRKYKFHR